MSYRKTLRDDTNKVLARPERQKRIPARAVGGLALFPTGAAQLNECAGDQRTGGIGDNSIEAGSGHGLRLEEAARSWQKDG